MLLRSPSMIARPEQSTSSRQFLLLYGMERSGAAGACTVKGMRKLIDVRRSYGSFPSAGS